MYSKGQLVQPSDDGSRPGYDGREKFTEAEKKANIEAWEKNTGLKIKDQNKNVKGKISRGETTGKAGTGKYGKKTFNQLLENKSFTDFFKKDYPQYNLKNLLKGLDNPKTISTTKGILKSAVQAHETYLDLQEKVPKNYIREKDLEKLLDIDLKAARTKNAAYFSYIEETLGMEKIQSKLGDKTRYYYKKPSSKQITDITEFSARPYLQQRTLDNVNILSGNKYVENSLIKGELPKLKRVQKILENKGIKASDSQVAKAVSTLGQLWRGDEFQNKITFDQNKKLGNTIYKLFEKLDNTNPYAREMYNIALQEISLEGGNKRGDFRKWKNALNKELERLGVPIYKPAQSAKYNAQGKLIKKAEKAVDGFNVNEVTSIKASARNNIHTYAYFVDLTKGDINQKALARFQGEFSKTLTKVDKLLADGKNIKAREIINTWNTDKVPNFKSVIEKKHGIEAANNLNLPEIKYGTKIDPKIYTSSQLKKYKNYGIDIKGMAKDKKYYVDVKKAVPIQDLKSEKSIKNLLKNFEAYGCKGKAAGGRILFSNGGEAITTCAKKGVQGFIDDLKSGNYSKATKDILKGGGQFIKGALNPMELLKLRNLIGPAAMGFMAAFEGGVITDDVIRQGTPLNESLANNWLTKSFLPYTKQYAQAKNLLESGTVPSNMKKYVQDVVTFNDALMDIKGIENRKDSRLVDNTGYGMIDGTSMYTKEQEQKDEADLMKKIGTLTEDVITPGSAKALEMKSLQDEMEATRMAKKEFSPIFGFDKLKDVRTPRYTGFDYVPDEQPVDLRPITYQDAEYTDVRMPVGLEQAYMNKFGLKPRDSLSNYKFKDSDISILQELTDDYNKFQRQKEASKYPGYFGANEKFSEGGIASLNVNKK
jgi:hypothetical protein